MPEAEKIRETMRTYVERWNAGDRDGWVALFTDDAHHEDPVGGPVNRGPEAIATFWDTMKGLAPSRLDIVAGPVVCGSEAAMPVLITVDLGDNQLKIDAVDVMAFDDDARISSLRAFVEFPGQ